MLKTNNRTLCLAAILLLQLQGLAQERQSQLPAAGWKVWLDRQAAWKNDALFLPPAAVTKMTVAAPSCGWDQLFAKSLPEAQAKQIVADPSLSMQVQVPGTVEAFYWDALSGNRNGLGTSGDYTGVSWWGDDFTIAAAAKGKRIKLFFSEGIRQRAEVFINRQLAGYELVHQTPFEIDITDAVKYGGSNQLAVRITDAGGNFSWGDYTGQEWGDYLFPLSHGFGGILGPVYLKVVDPVHVGDVFVKNKKTLRDIETDITVSNQGSQSMKVTVTAEIREAWKHNIPVTKPAALFNKLLGSYTIPAGQSVPVSFAASVTDALLWGIRDANLYHLVVTIKDAQGKVLDQYTQRFGFRFLSVEGYGKDARFYLNGKRTFLLSAISWGFWPVNGIFPTPELARKHIASALALGQNMLNFHRCQGNSLVLNMADEMGILYYEEPGGYSSSRTKEGSPLRNKPNQSLAMELNSQRFLRMVKRDRNHPSLVIYNMVNEPGWIPDEQAKKDMAAAHLLDPTRLITYGSGFMAPKVDQPLKLHTLPYDSTQRTTGYLDIHNAGNSPGVYVDYFYNSPTSFRRNERYENELFVWGEEGALASPPQLELIQKDLEKAGRNGWDGADYKNWYNAYNDYIKSKGLEKYYPSLTGLITSLGNIMYYEHGRLLENVRIADGADLNVLNGYEDMKFDNFSGAVDVFRNLKGNPELISQYMRPLYVAVKAREKAVQVGDTSRVDLFIINEHAVRAGDYKVEATIETPGGKQQQLFSGKVHLSGGDKFSDLVTENLPVALNAGKGYYRIKAALISASGKKLADGHDELFAVDWQSDRIEGKGAVVGNSPEIFRFVRDQKKGDLVAFSPALDKLDYILACPIDQGEKFKPISSFNFYTKDRKTPGLHLDYFRGGNFNQRVDQRVSTAAIDFDTKSKLIPGYDILGETDFSVRWEGVVVSELSGATQFEFAWDDGAKVWFDGEQVVDAWSNGPKKTKVFERNLVAGKAYTIKIEAFQAGGGWEIALKWKLPVLQEKVDIAAILKRVREDGTKLILAEGAETWLNNLKPFKVVPEYKIFHPAKTWVGHNFFVREHPFFAGLPVNAGMNWEYQRLVVYDGPSHFGLYDIKGEEPVVSLVGGASQLVSTAVGIIPYGKGSIVFSSLDLVPNLVSDSKAAGVPKKIFCNYLQWAVQH